ncbi:MAG: CCA tRNA nucleotidyltransferase [Verrucomicrobiota bacterium]
MKASSALEHGARNVVAKLQAAGHQALYAGGCVRDMLRNVQPHDYDIATSARPEEVQALFRRTIAIGAQFGVISVLDGNAEYQVATFRSDGTYQDGRHPDSVTFSSAEEDAKRRDFTINGLFFDPIENTLRDYVGGQKDLQIGLLRAIGNPSERFAEDRLRMLRAIRFATVLEFEICPETWTAICTQASHLCEVSEERIREEFLKIMLSPARVRGLDLLDSSGLLQEILPEMEALKGCEQPPQFHPEGDVWVHTRLMLSLLPESVSTPLVLSVLLHDIAKPATFTYDEVAKRIRFSGHEKLGAEMTEQILTRLRFSRKEIDATVEAVANHMAFKDVQQMRVARLKRFLARSTIQDELALHRVDCASSNGDLSNYDFLNRKIEEFSNEPLIPEPLITGRDLIPLGYKPGPQFKEILEAVQNRQLEGTLHSKSDSLLWVKEQFPLSE